MSFFSDAFKKLTSKTPAEKAVSSSLSYGVNSLGDALGDKLYSIGMSSGVVGKLAASAADALLSGASNEFFTGSATSRISAQALTMGRDSSSMSSNTHAATVTPEGKMSASGFQSFSYPDDLGEYYISFEIVDYERPSPFVAGKWNKQCTLNLPIPFELMEGHAVTWRDADTGMIGAIADAYAKYQAGQDPKFGETIGQGAVNYGLRFISPDAFGTVGQFAGGIPNPNMTMFFEGPTFQEQEFTWIFAPQSASESFLVKAMIQQFRIAMLPTATFNGSSNFLNYPKAVQMRLHAGSSEASHLYKMKKAIIPGINVNYAPNGHPQFFRGTKAPKFIAFTLKLKSIEYFLASDFDSSIAGNNDWANALEGLKEKTIEGGKQVLDQLGDFIGG